MRRGLSSSVSEPVQHNQRTNHGKAGQERFQQLSPASVAKDLKSVNKIATMLMQKNEGPAISNSHHWEAFLNFVANTISMASATELRNVRAPPVSRGLAITDSLV